jgi:hypothetical protein
VLAVPVDAVAEAAVVDPQMAPQTAPDPGRLPVARSGMTAVVSVSRAAA